MELERGLKISKDFYGFQQISNVLIDFKIFARYQGISRFLTIFMGLNEISSDFKGMKGIHKFLLYFIFVESQGAQ